LKFESRNRKSYENEKSDKKNLRRQSKYILLICTEIGNVISFFF